MATRCFEDRELRLVGEYPSDRIESVLAEPPRVDTDTLRGDELDLMKIGHVDVSKATANAFWSGLGARYVRTENFYNHNEVNVYVYDIR